MIGWALASLSLTVELACIGGRLSADACSAEERGREIASKQDDHRWCIYPTCSLPVGVQLHLSYL